MTAQSRWRADHSFWRQFRRVRAGLQRSTRTQTDLSADRGADGAGERQPGSVAVSRPLPGCEHRQQQERLGIEIERTTPGHPEQNGRHERMHLTLKKDATKPAAANVLQQQARFDAFVDQYNRERPHQALAMKVPADLYRRSSRVYVDPASGARP